MDSFVQKPVLPEDAYLAIRRNLPAASRCIKVGLYDVEEVQAAFQEDCISALIDGSLQVEGVGRRAKWFPGNYARKRRQEFMKLQDIGRVSRPDRFQGRVRKPIHFWEV